MELLAFGVYNTVGQRARARAELAAERMQNARKPRRRACRCDRGGGDQCRRPGQTALRTWPARWRTSRSHWASPGQAERARSRPARPARRPACSPPCGRPPRCPALPAGSPRPTGSWRQRRQRRDDAEESRGDRPAGPRRATRQDPHGDVPPGLRRPAGPRRAARPARAGTCGEGRRTGAAGGGTPGRRTELRQARDDRAEAERSHAAIALAQGLQVGEDCPVCLRPVTALPHHAAPAGLEQTQQAVDRPKATPERTGGHGKAASAAAGAGSAATAPADRWRSCPPRSPRPR